MHDIRYDAIHDEILIMNPYAQAILVFRGGAQGEEPPIRIIQGPHTQLVGTPLGGPVDRLEVDPVHNEIFVPAGEAILVFPRDGNGDVAPIRAIRGPDTQLHVTMSAGVDPVHNLLVVADAYDTYERVGPGTGSVRLIAQKEDSSLVIFNRTDNGNVKPKAVIKGPKTLIKRITQMQVYPPKGWIIVTQPGRITEQDPFGAFVGVWSINDNGDVPARWIIKGPKSNLKKPRGIALNPKNKEIIVSDNTLNQVLTFYFPEMF